jgi:glycosyltransferase involved in cell wall biosynthesis
VCTHRGLRGMRRADYEVQEKGPIVYVVNVSWFFISHRLELARQAARAGYDVHVATCVCGDEDARVIRESGLTLHHVNFGRDGSRVIADVVAFASLLRLIRRLRPVLLHLVGVKMIVIGGLAARAASVATVMAITGLGHAFIQGGYWSNLRSRMIVKAMRFVAGRPRCAVIFQNEEDRDAFVSRGIVSPEMAHLIRGSGVDLQQFKFLPEPAAPVRILLASRMLRTKGIPEFVAAAKLLKVKWPDAQFLLAGNPDSGNPTSITEEELNAWNTQGCVSWLKHQRDVPALLASVHIVTLPTYYKEGVPKVLIEAAACGRPIVTTDTPGCRDIVRNGLNGFLVPQRDSLALTDALDHLIGDSNLRVAMGQRGRALAETEFGIAEVIDRTLRIYGELQSGDQARKVS